MKDKFEEAKDKIDEVRFGNVEILIREYITADREPDSNDRKIKFSRITFNKIRKYYNSQKKKVEKLTKELEKVDWKVELTDKQIKQREHLHEQLKIATENVTMATVAGMKMLNVNHGTLNNIYRGISRFLSKAPILGARKHSWNYSFETAIDVAVGDKKLIKEATELAENRAQKEIDDQIDSETIAKNLNDAFNATANTNENDETKKNKEESNNPILDENMEEADRLLKVNFDPPRVKSGSRPIKNVVPEGTARKYTKLTLDDNDSIFSDSKTKYTSPDNEEEYTEREKIVIAPEKSVTGEGMEIVKTGYVKENGRGKWVYETSKYKDEPNKNDINNDKEENSIEPKSSTIEFESVDNNPYKIGGSAFSTIQEKLTAAEQRLNETQSKAERIKQEKLQAIQDKQEMQRELEIWEAKVKEAAEANIRKMSEETEKLESTAEKEKSETDEIIHSIVPKQQEYLDELRTMYEELRGGNKPTSLYTSTKEMQNGPQSSQKGPEAQQTRGGPKK